MKHEDFDARLKSGSVHVQEPSDNTLEGVRPKLQIVADNRDLMHGVSDYWFDQLTLQQQLECVTDMLAHVPHIARGGRDGWYKIIAAVARGLGEPGRVLAREWSQTCPDKYDAADFERTYTSFLRSIH